MRGSILLALNLILFNLLLIKYGALGRGLESMSEGTGSNSGSNCTAKEKDLVVGLPGQPNVSFAHYAGYVTVNQTHGRALFYWFFEADSDPASKPLLLWLNGGPGCSSVGYGEMMELGPFLINKDGASVSYNSYTWNKEVNLLFIESPVGVGFSYSNTSTDYDNSGDAQTALDAYAFLVGWLERFPEYKHRDFFIAGESYGGHYVPQLAKAILDKNKSGRFKINLKAILMGNALIHDGLDTKGIVDYAWSHAVLSDAFYSNISSVCGDYNQNSSQECVSLVSTMYGFYTPITMIYSLYSDICLNTNSSKTPAFFKALNTKGKQLMSNMIIASGGVGGGPDPCMANYVNAYLNRQDVQQALHATQTGPSFIWSGCSTQIAAKWDWADAPFSMLPTLKELMVEGIPIWMYSGDWDGRIPVLSTRYSIGSMDLQLKVDWHPWYYHQQVAGSTEEYEGITYATVRAAGHAVPSFQPGPALALLSHFLTASPLPQSP